MKFVSVPLMKFASQGFGTPSNMIPGTTSLLILYPRPCMTFASQRFSTPHRRRNEFGGGGATGAPRGVPGYAPPEKFEN